MYTDQGIIRSAEVLESIQHASDYGIEVTDSKADFGGMVKRSRGIANKMSKGVHFLMKANKIQVFIGTGVFDSDPSYKCRMSSVGRVNVLKQELHYCYGARPRVLPNLPIDGKMIIDSEIAMTMAAKKDGYRGCWSDWSRVCIFL